DDEHECDNGETEDQQADLAPFACFVGAAQPMFAGPAQQAPECRHHCPPNRSTVATWVADTGIRIGTIPEKNAGTSGIGTQTVAETRTRPSGRRQGVLSHPITIP